MKPFSLPSIGVDISDESFKYMRLEYRRGRREIAFFGDKDLPKDAIDSGEIKNVSKVAEALKDTLINHRSDTPYLILSLPEEKGFLRLIKMQSLPVSEIRNALSFQLEEHIPFPPSELYFDFKILKSDTQTQKEMDVVIMAYPKAIVESYMKAVTTAGFTPILFELESQAVARSIVPKGSVEAILIGDIGKTRTTFSIIYRGSVLFTSTIGVGGRDIDATLKDSLHVSEEQARDIKIGRGLDFTSEEIIKSLSPSLGALKGEAERQIKFWDRRKDSSEPEISKVFLCGGDAHLKGLPEALSGDLSVSVERARIWENLFDMTTYVPPIRAHTTLRYATAFGLAMRGDEDLFTEKL